MWDICNISVLYVIVCCVAICALFQVCLLGTVQEKNNLPTHIWQKDIKKISRITCYNIISKSLVRYVSFPILIATKPLQSSWQLFHMCERKIKPDKTPSISILFFALIHTLSFTFFIHFFLYTRSKLDWGRKTISPLRQASIDGPTSSSITIYLTLPL